MAIGPMKAVWEHSRTEGAARLTLTLIANSANEEGWNSFQKLETLAMLANCSERTVARHIEQAVRLDELEVHRPDRSRQCHYSIMLPGVPVFEDPEVRQIRDEEFRTKALGRAAKTAENRAIRNANRRSEDMSQVSGPSASGPDTCDRSDLTPTSGPDLTPVTCPDLTPVSGLKEETPRNSNETPLKVSDGKPPEEQEGLSKRLCEEFGDLLRADGVKVHNPTSSEWVAAARLMLDRDGRHPDEIRSVMRWSRGDEFWRANVLSMPKLRKQFDQLRLKAAAKVVQLREAAADITLRAPDRELGKAIRKAIGDDPVDIYIGECWHGMRGEVYVLGGAERIVSWVALRYGGLLSKVAQNCGYADLELVASSPPANAQPQEDAA